MTKTGKDENCCPQTEEQRDSGRGLAIELLSQGSWERVGRQGFDSGKVKEEVKGDYHQNASYTFIKFSRN